MAICLDRGCLRNGVNMFLVKAIAKLADPRRDLDARFRSCTAADVLYAYLVKLDAFFASTESPMSASGLWHASQRVSVGSPI